MSAPGPSRASLINKAIDDGSLDPVTGLVYRARSALALSGVPDEFASGVPRPDDSVFTEMALMMPSLSQADQAKFEPYLIRPTDAESVFANPQVAAIGGGQLAQAGTPAPPCKTWANSDQADSHFKVWACADDDAAKAASDIAAIVKLFQPLWDSMTKAVPDGMGPPMPDNFTTSNAAQYGGDPRIDVYALDLGHYVYRDYTNNEIDADAAAEAIGTQQPFTDGASSGFMLVNRNRLGDETKMRQDVIHEFFHVLQYAHAVTATHQGRTGHWFTEASAVWAETFYDRPHSQDPHNWFPAHFQSSTDGLESQDPDHTYAAYVWPFFMEQEAKPGSIFNAWQQIGAIKLPDFSGVTKAIDQQLSFKDNFHEFAVRNLNLIEVLSGASVKRYSALDPNFAEDYPPQNMVDTTITAGEPFLSHGDPTQALGASYFQFSIAPTTKQVTISLANVTPASQTDGDLLLHFDGGQWKRQSLAGGAEYTFCRDKDKIDGLYLVLSNHSTAGPLGGSVEASGKESCEEQTRLVGDVTWNETITDTIAGISQTTAGTAHIDVLWDPLQHFVAQGDSRYEFTYTISNCVPSSASFAGTLRSSTESIDAAPGMGVYLHHSGAPGQDMSFSLKMNESWMAECPPQPYGQPVQTYAGFEFPGCTTGGITGLYDSTSGTYNLNCQPAPDLLGSTYTVSGQVTGTLTPSDSGSPSP